VLFATLGLYLALLLPKLVWFDGDGGLWVGHEHLWSDWPLHIGMLRRFSDCPPESWLSQHPMVGGTPLRYPFFAAFVSGMLVRLGFSVPLALILPMYVGFALLLWGLWRLFESEDRRGWLALVPIFLFFLSAGPGGWEWLAEIRAGGWEKLALPPKEYGRIDEYQWYAGNFLVGMLLTQRAFLPGMTIAVWVLVWLRKAVESGEKRLFLLCGLAAGLLPIVHVHSLFAVIAFGVFFALPRFKAALLWAALPGGALAGTLSFLFLRPSFSYPNFISWHPFFVAPTLQEWPLMWWRLWGMALPTALVGALLGARGPLVKGGALLFLLGNLFLFQPIPWDNSKVFLWAYLGLCPAMTHTLGWLWARKWWGPPSALLLTFHLTITGLANVVHLWRTDAHRAMVLSAGDARLGEKVRRETPPDAVFLSAADVANPVMVWGARPIFMGFGGWMPNFGVPPTEAQRRERVIRTVLAGGPDAPALARESGVSYIFVGPSERSESWRADEAAIASRFPLWHRDGEFSVYKVAE
jgi:hypothetical protein